MTHDLDPRVARNLRRWQDSGEPLRWVQARGGQWNHGDWLALLEDLERSGYGPVCPDGVARILDESRTLWLNLRRWEAGPARDWVEARQGQWGHDDWLALLGALRRSDCWPIDPDAVHEVLERLTAEWWNLRRWQRSGQPRLWVEARRGQWGHAEWLALLESLSRSQFWPIDPAAVGREVEHARACYWNLRRWQDNGGPSRWLEAHPHGWSSADLAAHLEHSGYGPIDMAVAGAVLDELPRKADNLQRFRRSEEARRWIDARGGRWGHNDWLGLLAWLEGSSFWPLDVGALPAVLQGLNLEWWNLRRWQTSGLAERWVERRQGRWGHNDWAKLVESLQSSEFWPADPDAVARVVEEAAAQWRREHVHEASHVEARQAG
jgi:hypothetical protein